MAGKREGWLSPIGGGDADVLGGGVAGPGGGWGFGCMEICDDGDVVGGALVGGGGGGGGERLAGRGGGVCCHGDCDERGIELGPGASRSSENAAPVGIATGEGSFDKGRGGDGFRDLFGSRFGLGAADFDFDDALSAFAVGDDLLSKRAAN